MAKDKKEDVDFKVMYGEAATIKVADLIKKQKINVDKGLSTKQVNERINKYGYNELSKKKEKKWYNYFFESLFSKFNLIIKAFSKNSPDPQVGSKTLLSNISFSNSLLSNLLNTLFISS